jgi:predicted N-formylglutamate amidohydrolase
LPAPLIRALGAEPDIGPDAVGDNEPYDGGLPGDTINAIATALGLANALIELRQDLIGERAAAEAWADRLARIVAPLAAPAAIRAPQDWGSHAEGRPRPAPPA